MTELETMRDQLADAIRRTKVVNRLRDSGECRGVSLCTDGNLSTLYLAAFDSTWQGANPDREFWPPDWPYEDGGDSALDDPADSLEALYRRASDLAADGDADAMRAHIEDAFGVLVDALNTLREEGFFDPGVVLLVLATDPNPTILRLADAAAMRLNTPQVLERWRKYWPKSRWQSQP